MCKDSYENAHVCYCPSYSQSRCSQVQQMPIVQWDNHALRLNAHRVKISNRLNYFTQTGEQEFNVNSYSGSSKVIHLEITEKASRDSICCIHIRDILCKVSVPSFRKT